MVAIKGQRGFIRYFFCWDGLQCQLATQLHPLLKWVRFHVFMKCASWAGKSNVASGLVFVNSFVATCGFTSEMTWSLFDMPHQFGCDLPTSSSLIVFIDHESPSEFSHNSIDLGCWPWGLEVLCQGMLGDVGGHLYIL